MPSGIGASYRSLSDDVYKTTTVAENRFSVIESVKKAFSFAGGNRRSDPLISRSESAVLPQHPHHQQIGHQQQPSSLTSLRDRKMPTSTSAEETALLG